MLPLPISILPTTCPCWRLAHSIFWVCATQTGCSGGKASSCALLFLLHPCLLCWYWWRVVCFLCYAHLFCHHHPQGWCSCIPSLYLLTPCLQWPSPQAAICVGLRGVQTSLPVSPLLFLLMPVLVLPVLFPRNAIAQPWLPNTDTSLAIFSVK